MTLIAVGKTREPWLIQGAEIYASRLQHYGKFNYIETPDPKLKNQKADPKQVMAAEAALLGKHLTAADWIILLDEQGKSRTSEAAAEHLQKLQNRGLRHVIWVIGGPYGFDPIIRDQAHEFWSLSPLTFSHQMIRPFALEQLYRMHTILKGEPYHHA